MCGISGAAAPLRRGLDLDVQLVERMSAALTHRGPDDSGLVVDGNVALANRRLSIVDVPGGHQPMTSEDGRVTVTYNGEIYNAPELRRTLEQRGRRYQTRCDTEALLHLYAEYGVDLVEHLRGCFAFALWDRSARQLVLVRDRLGVKPLYFIHADNGSLYFASEIKALLAGGVVSAELNFAALPGYLANRATYGTETLFAGVNRLLPGHRLVWRDGEITIDQYWDIEHPSHPDGRTDSEYIEEWSQLFRESVRLRLMADVPIGVFLSGGIDSSAIAAVMSDLVDEPVQTFSVGFADGEANELEYARLVAQTFHTNHHDIVITPEDFFAALPQLTWHSDEPMGHPAGVPLFFVSQLAAQHAKAVLSGEGSDETLAGYGRYRLALLNLKLGKQYERATTDSLRRLVARRISGRRLARTFLARPVNPRNLLFENFGVFDRAARSSLLTAEAATRVGSSDPHAEVEAFFDADPDAEMLERMLYADSKTYLHALLMKQDRMSMAASLESRVPFLDHELVQLSARLPPHLKLRRGWTTKHVLRSSMAGVLPKEVLSRRKLGFPVPVDTWFRGPFRLVVDEYVLGERARRRGLFEHEFVARLVNEHQAGARHGERLWTLVSIELWARCFMDGEEPARPELALAREAP